MSPTLTYPGVYVEEIPSGVRPITGVATSITAFVGRALRGPVDQAVTITSYGDFERIFGGAVVPKPPGDPVQGFRRRGRPRPGGRPAGPAAAAERRRRPTAAAGGA